MIFDGLCHFIHKFNYHMNCQVFTTKAILAASFKMWDVYLCSQLVFDTSAFQVLYKTCYLFLFKIGFLFYHFIVRSVQQFIYLPEKTKAKKHPTCYKNCSQGEENSNFQRFPVLFTSGESAYNKIMLSALCTSIFHELKNFRTQRFYTKKSFLPAGNKMKVFEFLVLSQYLHNLSFIGLQ